jgi:hypothetical protein
MPTNLTNSFKPRSHQSCRICSLKYGYHGFGGTLPPFQKFTYTLKIEADCYSETLVAVYQTIRGHIPKDHCFNIHCCRNLTSHILFKYLSSFVTVLSTTLCIVRYHTLIIYYLQHKFHCYGLLPANIVTVIK